MPKTSRDSLFVAASLLTVAEAITGHEEGTQLMGQDPGKLVYEAFKKHLDRLAKDNPSRTDRD